MSTHRLAVLPIQSPTKNVIRKLLKVRKESHGAITREAAVVPAILLVHQVDPVLVQLDVINEDIDPLPNLGPDLVLDRTESEIDLAVDRTGEVRTERYVSFRHADGVDLVADIAVRSGEADGVTRIIEEEAAAMDTIRTTIHIITAGKEEVIPRAGAEAKVVLRHRPSNDLCPNFRKRTRTNQKMGKATINWNDFTMKPSQATTKY